MNRQRTDDPSWVQPALIPVLWPLVIARSSLSIPGDGSEAMFNYSVTGCGDSHTLLAQGIEWVADVHKYDQRAEVFHDLVKIALEHLAPF